ncbi:hypothetical protein ACFL5A_00275 [Gemmatimonadota bacterium]
MPVTYRIESGVGLVLTTASGTVTDDEALRHQAALSADPGFRPDLRQLVLFTEATAFFLTTEGVKRLASTDPFSVGSRRAFVADQDLQFGIARMYQAMTEGTGAELRVFRDEAEARNWLGLET